MGRFWILSVALALCAAPVFGQQEGDEIDRTYHNVGLAKREKPTLLDLVRRQTCRYPCPNTDTCASTSTDKCCDVGGFCYAWEECCGGGCISFVQTCCTNGNYCDSLEKCCNDSFGGCCEVGYSCNANTGRCSFGGGGGTGGTTGNAATPGTATRTATAATATATGNRYYYFTITWAYTSWYYNYDFDIRFSTVTSTRITTSTRTSVFASNAAAASNQFDAMTAFFITPAPPFSATSLSASASQINAARSSSAGARSTSVALGTPTAGGGGSAGSAGSAGVSGASAEAGAWSICTVAVVAFAPLLLAVAL